MKTKELRELIDELAVQVELSVNCAAMGDYDEGSVADHAVSDRANEIVEAFEELAQRADNFERAFNHERRMRKQALAKIKKTVEKLEEL